MLQALRNAQSGTVAKAKTKSRDIAKAESPQLHHTIPIFLCGGLDQSPNEPLLDAPTHRQLHKDMAIYVLALEAAAQVGLANLPPSIRLQWTKDNIPVILQLAAYNDGRAVIAAGLEDFYTVNQYMQRGINPTIEVGLDRETPRYVSGANTSLRLGCSRPGPGGGY